MKIQFDKFEIQYQTIQNQKFQGSYFLTRRKYAFQVDSDIGWICIGKLLRTGKLCGLQCFSELCDDFTGFGFLPIGQHHDFAERKH